MDSLPENLEIQLTADGSPTICFSEGGRQEKMHNSQGALGESLYIYGHGLELMLRQTSQPRVVSVGLGLGYCEMIAASLAMQAGRPVALWSFESDEYLRTSLLNWIDSKKVSLRSTYDAVLAGVAEKFHLVPEVVKARMQSAIRDGSWQVRRSFPEDSAGISNANCVLFDAYSSKTSPALWEERMLTAQVAEVIGPDCVFVTYAATGALNRALAALGFELKERAGFAGKRQSTLAVRGLYANS